MAGKASAAAMPAAMEGMPTRIRVISWTALGSTLPVPTRALEDFDAATVPESDEAICSQMEREVEEEDPSSLVDDDEVDAEKRGSVDGVQLVMPVTVTDRLGLLVQVLAHVRYLESGTNADADADADDAMRTASRKRDSTKGCGEAAMLRGAPADHTSRRRLATLPQ